MVFCRLLPRELLKYWQKISKKVTWVIYEWCQEKAVYISILNRMRFVPKSVLCCVLAYLMTEIGTGVFVHKPKLLEELLAYFATCALEVEMYWFLQR